MKPQTVRAAILCPVQSVLSHRRSKCVGKVIITSQAKIFLLFTLVTLGLLPRFIPRFIQVWRDKIQGHSRALLFQGPHTQKNLKLTKENPAFTRTKPCTYVNYWTEVGLHREQAQVRKSYFSKICARNGGTGEGYNYC